MKGLRDVDEVTKVDRHRLGHARHGPLSLWIWEQGETRTLELLFGSTNVGSTSSASRSRYGEILVVVVAAALAIGAAAALHPHPARRRDARGRSTTRTCSVSTATTRERIALTSWALGSALAAFAGVVVTPVVGGSLDAITLTLLIIDTFAAAMFGRLRSIPRTFVGAMVLGLACDYIVGYAPTRFDWVSNLRGALPADPAVRRRCCCCRRTGCAASRSNAAGSGRAVPSVRSGAGLGRGLRGPGRPARQDRQPDDDRPVGQRDGLRDHRAVAGAADRVRGRDQPGADVLRRPSASMVAFHIGIERDRRRLADDAGSASWPAWRSPHWSVAWWPSRR